MHEFRRCAYCNEETEQSTELVFGDVQVAYETTCTVCKNLVRWYLMVIKKKKKEEDT